MAAANDKSKKSELFRQYLRRLLDFVFGFKNNRGDVLDYKLAHADSLNFPPQEFYARVEQTLAARKIPGMEISRVHFNEGGLLSDQRVYLRLMRERLCIDTCAAPFGNIFFFSTRTVYVPALVRLWHILAAFLFLGGVFSVLVKPLGANYAAFATVALVFALVGVLRNAAADGGSDLDTLLLKIPVVGTIYEDWFRVETYYREDTRNLYLQLLPQFIEELANETCAANGAKLHRHFQPTPPVSDLNKPQSPDTKPA
ncbi:MAG: hypothetical protein WCK57_09990 [Verrucomicrobiae bacterium]